MLLLSFRTLYKSFLLAYFPLLCGSRNHQVNFLRKLEMIKEAHDHLTACDYRARTLTQNPFMYWKASIMFRKIRNCANARLEILTKVILNRWYRMRSHHAMQLLSVCIHREEKQRKARIHKQQLQEYALMPFRLWEFHWKEALLRRHSPSSDSFKKWVHRNHVQSKKIAKQWLSLACATLEVVMKAQRKTYKNSKRKFFKLHRRMEDHGGTLHTISNGDDSTI